MPSNKKNKINKKNKSTENTEKQVKDKNNHKISPKNVAVLNRAIRKDNSGNSNWKNFIEMENLKGGSSRCKLSGERVKLPVLKTGRLEGNKWGNVKFQPRPGQVTSIVGMDCEMVGVGVRGSESILARVSIVNSFGDCIYDKYVKPTAEVTDYRTFVSGIRPNDLKNGEDFFKVQSEVAQILKGKILVGHALNHDFQALCLGHPKKLIRDTTKFEKFRRESRSTLSLKNLANDFLGVKIQSGEHDSAEDARAAMQLYMMYRAEWEKERREARLKSNKNKNIPINNLNVNDEW